jgi:peroxiredoxin
MRTVVLAALLLATGLVGLLAWQNRALRGERLELMDRVRLPYAGLHLPEIEARGLDGEPVRLSARHGQPQMLVYFNTSCPYCLASLPAWESLRVELETAGGLVVLGLSLDPADRTRVYAAQHDLRFPVALLEDERARALYRTILVPQVVLVDGEGRVRYARPGVLEPGSPALDSILAAVTALTAGERGRRR